MKTKAVRLHGEMDLRLDEFELPEPRADEILAEVVTDSLCMSTYKVVLQGTRHRKVPEDAAERPTIVGHEFCGVIRQVGEKWKDQFAPGDHFIIQPNTGDERGYAVGYSYHRMGGDATYIILSNLLIENGCLMKFNGETFYEGSLIEPLCCVVGAFNAQYHMEKMYSYKHVMGIREGGAMALLGATGPMGYLAIDLAVHGRRKPSVLVVTGRTESKLETARRLYPEAEAAAHGVRLVYVNVRGMENADEALRQYTDGGKGFDDVFVMVPDSNVVNYASKMLAYDGCLNFFSGPADSEFSATVNFYNIHYNYTHFIGTSGGNTDDLKEAKTLVENKTVDVGKIVTHVLGLDSAAETSMHLKDIPGAKKLCYTHQSFPLTEIAGIGGSDPFSSELSEIIKRHGGLWSAEAERYFLAHAPKLP